MALNGDLLKFRQGILGLVWSLRKTRRVSKEGKKMEGEGGDHVGDVAGGSGEGGANDSPKLRTEVQDVVLGEHGVPHNADGELVVKGNMGVHALLDREGDPSKVLPVHGLRSLRGHLRGGVGHKGHALEV